MRVDQQASVFTQSVQFFIVPY